MATWRSEIQTKEEFAAQLGQSPELIFISGNLSGRMALQSLPTVMDEYAEICVVNTRAPWSAVVQRRSRNCFTLFAPKSLHGLKNGPRRK